MSEFVWTFPLYALATGITRGEDGEALLNDDIQFVAPHMPIEQQLAIFTDQDLARSYLSLCNPDLGLRPLNVANPSELAHLLARAKGRYRYLVVDLNPKTHIGRMIPLAEELARLEGQGHRGRPGDRS